MVTVLAIAEVHVYIQVESVTAGSPLPSDKGQKVKLSLCLTNYAPRHEDVWGSGCIDPRIPDLGTS
jgi:hypothetical protein